MWALDMQDRYPMQVPVTNGGTMELVSSGAAWVHFRVMSNELNTPKVLFCPNEKGKDRIIATTFGWLPTQGQVPYTNDNNVAYFVGVDASQTNWSMWLSGDHNITNRLNPKHGLLSFPTNRPTGWTADLHNGQGNIGLADGSVQQYNNARVQAGLAQTGVQRIRLAMP
jgi:prepilin-type processing-associated H-X9-DG protein